MEKRDTKREILMAALALFSVDGYEGVSVKRIADAVGIKDSSLYKHFRSKQEIFDSLLEEMNRQFADIVETSQIPSGDPVVMAEQYGESDLMWLQKTCETIFLFFLRDPYASKFRRMLMIEQYKNSQAAEILRSFFIDIALDFQARLFGELSRQGYMHAADPHVMALQFYAPFYLLLAQYDGQEGKEEEALAHLMNHVAQFAKLYETNDKGRKEQ